MAQPQLRDPHLARKPEVQRKRSEQEMREESRLNMGLQSVTQGWQKKENKVRDWGH